MKTLTLTALASLALAGGAFAQSMEVSENGRPCSASSCRTPWSTW
jgi:hypothetical protein